MEPIQMDTRPDWAATETLRQLAAVEEWNANHPPGTRVIVTLDNASRATTKTRSEAWMLGADGTSPGHTAVVLLEGRTGAFLLSRCKPMISAAKPEGEAHG